MLRNLSRHVRQNAVAWLALFVALGGTTYAATGGNFVLGQSNTAGASSSLTAPVAGKALQITNPSTAGGASALGLSVGSGRPPLTTNSATKVDNLNADRLDGHDSSYFLPVFGKAADANTLDGKDSTDFIQGQGRIESFDRVVAASSSGQLVDIPNLALVTAGCSFNSTTRGGEVDVRAAASGSANVFEDFGGSDPRHFVLPAGGLDELFTVPDDETILSLSSAGRVATVFVFSNAFHNPVLNQDLCEFQGHAIVH